MLFVADLLSMWAGVLIALALRRSIGVAPGLTAEGFIAHILLFTVFCVVCVLRLGVGGQYDSGQRFSRIDDLLVVARGGFVAVAVATFLGVATKGFLLDFETYSRSFVALGCGLPLVLLAASRLLGHRLQVAAFRQGRYLARSLVVGGGARADHFLDWLTRHPHLGLHGRLSTTPLNRDLATVMRSFTLELDDYQPDEVILALERPQPALRAAMVREAAFRGVAVKVLPDVFENYYDMQFPRYEGIPVSTIYETDADRFGRHVKHIVDRLGAGVGLIVVAPLLSMIALAIFLEDRGPVIFAQERVGERGRRFHVRKFRTMHLDAEQRRAELAARNEAVGPLFKMRDDPRVTRVGALLRRTSLDELPQLWNVAFGEMSLVGPRPPLPSEVDEYRLEHRRRLLARPGMTGLWQTSGRSDTTFDQMVELDLLYIENWSFWLDVKILLRTVWVVASGRGAY